MRAIEIQESSQVAEARRVAVTLAQLHGFQDEDAGRLAIVATELSTNMIKHGGGGILLIGRFEDSTGVGIECVALDRGAGISDLCRSLRDGHSTSGSPGTGLGAIVRGSHFTEMFSQPGAGTAILARLMIGKPAQSDFQEYPRYGAVSVPVKGEDVCGDGWSIDESESGFSMMVADGLGHGPHAAEAAHDASKTFQQMLGQPPSETLSAMHSALKSTRGAAVAIANVNLASNSVTFSGVGNVAATLVNNESGVQRMVSDNGTIGHFARKIRNFEYSLASVTLVILASDGLATSWRLDSYPGLTRLHPTLIASVLYRDFHRGRDDATVLVCRVSHS